MGYEVRLKHMRRQPTAEVEFEGRPDQLPSLFPAVFEEVARYLGSHGIAFEGPAFAHFVPEGDAFEVEAGFIVPQPVEGEGRVVPGETPETDALTTVHIGPYGRLADAYEAIQAWAREHGGKLAEGMWELYYSGPETPPDQMRTEVYWPLEA
jgi:effector-binding domain-containing protein